MSGWYGAAKTAIMRGQIDFETDTIRATLVGAGYTYDAAHETTDDLTDQLAAPVVVSVTGVDNGAVAVDAVTFEAVASGATVKGVVVYRDGATPDATVLVAYIDRTLGALPLSVETDGTDFVFSFDPLVRI